MRTTYMAKPNEVERTWHIIDAEGKTLGRLASEAAALIRGKHKPQFTPHVDTGDFVIVINAEKIHLTGKKLQNKKYYRHSMHPGGLKVTTADQLLKTKPERVIESAVHGMIPKTRQGDHMKLRLKVYAGAEHPHAAQKPEVYELRG
ncbi:MULTISPECIES: 50S ribosomal protein L13 [unclassified Paenibacillus]|uniref:50S ribosomal protein L13 n=1 Tax=unclassified Paenibacillus TaxID=185978 RepID=UPI0024060B2F|nr:MULTISPECIES: 50S ribosomal protein L13 [unclassified Paenibacillus]MDF9844472.1 large subunit ribosomal protein L13 [Paenibacillus sp. PastF-2]MDF9851076.1 large subunit ribosomal protein L13 [Paenibacillus sp. PastM-2]MDF9857595.1 large subunit ribosomal protein L13 [Paenibacillus sp. PastF-1]MDH6482914.1 large subunit ribosomal protein L13 [Paenibacillus sp. PastH-2]MDH6510339.1 large subunit ribosomal protein L13 [Paenibacillus sp. PastM-3]